MDILDEKVTYVFRLFEFSNFFHFFSFASVINFLLGLLPVKKLLRKCYRDGKF